MSDYSHKKICIRKQYFTRSFNELLLDLVATNQSQNLRHQISDSVGSNPIKEKSLNLTDIPLLRLDLNL